MSGHPFYGQLAKIEASFTRPADTTAYAAGDVVGAASGTTLLTLADCARDMNKGFYIVKACLRVDHATVTNGTFKLHFFKDSLTPAADNAAFAPSYTEVKTKLGEVDFTLVALGSASGEDIVDNIRIACTPDTDTENIYAVLTATAAYTPKSGGLFEIEIYVDQN